jgi:plasmid stabilization system protein ParE
MSYRVIISARAEMEIEQAHAWWATHRSRRQADRWYKQFKKAIDSLSDNPFLRPVSKESATFPFEIRDLPFGLGSRPTHRAIFTIKGEEIQVLTIRHVAQPDLRKRDLP